MTYQSSPTITEKQKQIIYGTILGGSSIIMPNKGKNFYLAMRDKNQEWLSYKVDLLKNLFKSDKNIIKKDKNTYRAYSVSYPLFKDIYSLFYKGKDKIINRNVLELLTDQAWMVWFTDSGRKSKRKCYLRTNKFKEEGTNTIVKYFNSLDCECEMHKCRNRYEVVFTNKGSAEFLSIINSCKPSFLA
jgi:hypothetical protein